MEERGTMWKRESVCDIPWALGARGASYAFQHLRQAILGGIWGYKICYLADIGVGIAHGYAEGCQAYHAHVVVTVASGDEMVMREAEMVQKSDQGIGLVCAATDDLEEICIAEICIGNAIETGRDLALQCWHGAGVAGDDALGERAWQGKDIGDLADRHAIAHVRNLHIGVGGILGENGVADVCEHGVAWAAGTVGYDGESLVGQRGRVQYPVGGIVHEDGTIETYYVASELVHAQHPGHRADAKWRTARGYAEGEALLHETADGLDGTGREGTVGASEGAVYIQGKKFVS